MDILKSRKLWYSACASASVTLALYVCGTFHIPDLTGAAALAAIGAAWGLSVHHQGKLDVLPPKE